MVSRICFLNLHRLETGLYVADENNECSQIRQEFEKNGVSTMIYTDNALPSVEDFVDDLLSSMDDCVVFWCDSKNESLVKVIASQLLEMEPDTNIAYISTEEENVTGIENVITQKYISNIAVQLGLELEQISEIDRVEKDIEPEKNTDEHKTFHNGYVVSRLGSYTFQYRSAGYAKHVKIKEKDINDEYLQSLNKFCAINSSLYIEDGKVEQYENYKSKLEENGVLPINILFKEEDILCVNGKRPEDGRKIKEIPYSEAKKLQKAEEGTEYIYSLKTKDDLQLLRQELCHYAETSRIEETPLQFGQLKNLCRFQSRSACKMAQFPRFTIGSQGEMYPCDDCNESIGNVEQDYYEVVQELHIHHENVMKERNCKECKAMIYCPKCTMLPKEWGEDYCDLILNQPYVTDYLLEVGVIGRLLKIVPFLQGKELKEMKIINEYIPMYLKDVESGDCAPYFPKYLFVFSYEDNYIIWSITGKIYRISKEIAVVAEALLKRLKLEDVLDKVQKVCELSKEQAYMVCEAAIKHFDKCNLLYNKIDMQEFEQLKPQ